MSTTTTAERPGEVREAVAVSRDAVQALAERFEQAAFAGYVERRETCELAPRVLGIRRQDAWESIAHDLRVTLALATDRDLDRIINTRRLLQNWRMYGTQLDMYAQSLPVGLRRDGIQAMADVYATATRDLEALTDTRCG